MADPTYEDFTGRTPARGVRGWLLSLEEGVPTCLPDGLKGETVRSVAYSLAISNGFKVATKMVDGKMWVCRLKPEDVR